MATFGVAGDDLKTLQQMKVDKRLFRFGLSKCKFTISKKQVAEAEPRPTTPTIQGEGEEDGEILEDGKGAGNTNTEEGKDCPGSGTGDPGEDDVVEVGPGGEISGPNPGQDTNKGEPSKSGGSKNNEESQTQATGSGQGKSSLPN